MDKPISVGDLVVVVRECCTPAVDSWLGKVFRVSSIGSGSCECKLCGFFCIGLSLTDNRRTKSGRPRGVPASWVKRIPPAEELGIVNEDEEITA